MKEKLKMLIDKAKELTSKVPVKYWKIGGIALAAILVLTIGITVFVKLRQTNKVELVSQNSNNNTAEVTIEPTVEAGESTTPGANNTGVTSVTPTEKANNNASPTPTSHNGTSATATPTSAGSIAASPTPMVSPQASSAPAATNTPAAPTLTLSPTSIPKQDFNFSLNSVGNCSPNGSGGGNGTVTKNSNGYWDYAIHASLSNLLFNRHYQFWFCHNSGNCSSDVSAITTTDTNGNGSINANINGVSQNDPVQKIVIKDNDGGSSICLQTNFAW